MVSDNVLSVYRPPLQEKSRFDDSCFYRNMTLGQSAYDTNLNCFLFK